MKVAVLSLTRDRLEYTQTCFTRLRNLAGCDFDHFVLDQGSQDATPDWLRNIYKPAWLELLPDNVGISRGLNALLDNVDGYDVVVKFDNDCEVTTANVLRDTARLVYDNPKWLLSPHIQGLNSPPPVEREELVDGHRVGVTGLIGGIFLAANNSFYHRFRHDENNPTWGMDDVLACQRMHQQGGHVGYLLDHPAWHHETTVGQEARYPDYFARKHAEQGF